MFNSCKNEKLVGYLRVYGIEGGSDLTVSNRVSYNILHIIIIHVDNEILLVIRVKRYTSIRIKCKY